MKNVFKRGFAFSVDYLILAIYGTVLFLVTITFFVDPDQPVAPSPVKGQLIGFFTLTLPVFLYFFLFEKSRSGAIPGKRLFKLRVVVKPETKHGVLKRNLFKFLPWEIAHTGIHWAYAQSDNEELPLFLWVLFLVPQLIVFIYAISILISKGKTSLYDRWAGTELQFN